MYVAVAAIYTEQQLVDDRNMIHTHIGVGALLTLTLPMGHHLMGENI